MCVSHLGGEESQTERHDNKSGSKLNVVLTLLLEQLVLFIIFVRKIRSQRLTFPVLLGSAAKVMISLLEKVSNYFFSK